MLNQDNRILDYNKTNKVIIKSVNLDLELDLYLLINSADSNFASLVLNKVLDLSIDSISKENTYKDFSLILESVNSTLKTWRQDKEIEKNDITIFIGVLNKNNLLFSNIGTPSAYLIKNTNEVIEITEKNENKREFNFISDGKLDYADTIILSTTRLLNYLSYSDFTDSSIGKKTETLNKNIETILDDEVVEENIGIISFKYNFLDLDETKKSKLAEGFNKIGLKLLDNNVSKKILAYYMVAKDFINKQNKSIKNGLYIVGIISSIVVLFFVVNSIVGVTVETKSNEANIETLKQAREFIRVANDNSNNPEVFERNIEKAEVIIKDLREKKIFSNDVEQISGDLAIIKKQFNGIETFEETEENLIYKTENSSTIKVLKIDKKLYLVTHNSVIGPVISGTKAKEYIFNELKQDSFIDATVIGNDIALMTRQGKVALFTKNGHFSFKDVVDQKTWEKSKTILSYNKNIYLLPEGKNQIVKHTKNGTNFNKATPYLKEEDSKSIGKILDADIDGGIYLLKDDLSLVKFFSSPYRLESIVINKAPSSYKKEEGNGDIKIKVRDDLNYVYILLNNKIWVFQPNSKNPYSTQNVKYIGQIEGLKYKISEFYIDHDGEITILNENGVYKLTFEVNEDKLVVR